MIKEVNESIIINDKPNSYEFGKPGSRFKVYYNDLEDLRLRIKEAVDADLLRKKLQGDFDE